MKYLKESIYAIVSFVLSVWLFDTSILAMIFIFVGLHAIAETRKQAYITPGKSKIYGVVFGGCVCGAALIIVGKIVIDSQLMTMLGVMIFASCSAPLLVAGVVISINRWKEKKQGN